MHTGFTKENAFVAFLAANKACGICRDCCKSSCHIYISRDILTRLSETGDKRVKDILPSDILDVIRGLPTENGRVDKFKALAAFDTVSKICDNCAPDKHGAFCGINITLTALGTLLYGSSFQTEKDKV
ncbi:hypothetical protein [Sporomusa sp.]|uniref:hypothetical protein n=1 Tax=Sporomusa sp. TaxID=2078658 RepID=UPI002CD30C21|nr:hypothetical protein [Sporomusa sp.]HWR42140.1 hypothetical protein [Sporomusa sp.]